MSEMNYFLMYLSVVLPSLLRSDLILKENFCFGVFFILLFNFRILYWFCHISTWIHHRYTCVPHPENRWSRRQYMIYIMNNKKVKKLFSHRFKGFGYIILTHGERIYHFLRQYSLFISFMRPNMIRKRKREGKSFSV